MRPELLQAQVPAADSVRAQEALRDELSATSSKSVDYAQTPGLFSDDAYQSSIDQEAGGDIVLFSASPRVVKKQAGSYQVSISAFSPIRSVKANGADVEIGVDTYEATFTIDYLLEPGDNVIKVEVVSEAGEATKEFRIFYETETVKFADLAKARKSSFTLVVVLGIARDSNADSNSSDYQVAVKGSTTLVAVGQVATGFSSAFVITGILNVDDQYRPEYQSKEILFRQLSVDWNETESPIGDVTVGGGVNTVGLHDTSYSSNFRDPWNGSYMQGGDEVFASALAKVKLQEKVFWKTSLRQGQKTSPGASGVTITRKLGQGVSFDWLKLPWEGSVAYARTDAPESIGDFSKLEASLMVKPEWQSLQWSIQHGFTDTQYRILDPVKGVREQTAVMQTTLGVTWPLPGGTSLAYSHRYELQESNLSGKDFSKHLDTLNLTLIF